MNIEVTSLGSLWCCVYRSKQTKKLTRADMAVLLRDAQMRNVERGITGSLLRIDDSFLHYLEGGQEAIDRLFASLQRDPRHTHFQVLFREPIERRRFPNTLMDFSDLSRRSTHRGATKELLRSTLEDAPPSDGRGHFSDAFHRVWEGYGAIGAH
jgi:Sensors of blue-light using FAD